MKKEIKESIATVVHATTQFIEGKITREYRESIYDAHFNFINSLLEKERWEYTRKELFNKCMSIECGWDEMAIAISAKKTVKNSKEKKI